MSLAAGERKKETVQIECRWVGRVFQKVEAATENERRPTVDRRYGGTSSCCVNDDRNRPICVLLYTLPCHLFSMFMLSCASMHAFDTLCSLTLCVSFFFLCFLISCF